MSLRTQPHERLRDSHNFIPEACSNHATLHEAESKIVSSTIQNLKLECQRRKYDMSILLIRRAFQIKLAKLISFKSHFFSFLPQQHANASTPLPPAKLAWIWQPKAGAATSASTSIFNIKAIFIIVAGTNDILKVLKFLGKMQF